MRCVWVFVLTIAVTIAGGLHPLPAHAAFTCASYLSTINDNPTWGATGNGQGSKGGVKFSPSADCSVTSFTIYLTTTASVNATGYIYSNSGGVPGSVLDTCGTQSLASSPITWTCSDTTNLTSGGTYYIVIVSASWPSGTVFVRPSAFYDAGAAANFCGTNSSEVWSCHSGAGDEVKFSVSGNTPVAVAPVFLFLTSSSWW